MEPILELDGVTVHTYLEAEAGSSLSDDVLDGMTKPFKELSPKHLYDEVGADLFDQICEVPEYYPTRAEREILQLRSEEVVALTGASELVELGSGTAAKTRVLLDAMHEAGTLQRYVPFDVTEGMVRDVAAAVSAEYPGVAVHGIVGDFERHLHHVPASVGPRIVAFLGGTIGNFTPGSRRGFLRAMGELLGDDGHVLLGTDLVKDPAVLEAAYDDAAGVTAAFNRNLLHVINRELDADFEPDAFDHVAFFDREHEWIEMRLRAQRRMVVPIRALNLEVTFEAREEMRTEISTKFTRERLTADLEAAGLELVQLLTDPQERFALTLARRAPAA